MNYVLKRRWTHRKISVTFYETSCNASKLYITIYGNITSQYHKIRQQANIFYETSVDESSGELKFRIDIVNEGSFFSCNSTAIILH
jgi:hypothetical protein